MIQQILNHLNHPPMEFRGVPFWSWNGKLEETELRRQIRVMKEMGFGGFFMHSRLGLATEYLGEEWFRLVNACIDEAEKLGMSAWLYDEDRYSSGSAGGEVGREKQFRYRTLQCEVLKTPVFREEDIAWFAGIVDGHNLFSQRRLHHGESLRDGEIFLRFFLEYAPLRDWDNNSYAPDLMNPDAMRKFLCLTHERYAEHCGAKFGKSVPGIFSDEPHCSNWTEGMEEKFFRRYGEDLTERLPELFFLVDGKECSDLRWKLNNLRTELLCGAFAGQISQWCHAHGLAFTGHVFGEDSVLSQTEKVGSAMRFVEWMDLPGVDLLGERWMSFDAILQTASVAHQKGTGKTICETFAGCGWDFPLASQKAVADWQAALGITIFCQHLAFYTMAGWAKRDYPPSFLDQSPWHSVSRPMQDYFARLGALLAEGEPVRRILVVHPLESTWFWKPLNCYSPDEERAEICRLPRLRNALLSAKLAFDYGDEEMIARLASVEGKRVRLGKAFYSLMILPEMRTIRSSTLRLAEEFAKSGGTVLFLGPVPEYVDAIRSDRAEKGYATFRKTNLQTVAVEADEVRSIAVRTVDGKSAESILCSEVRGEEHAQLFLCNIGMELPDHVEMSAPLAIDRTLVPGILEMEWEIPETWQIAEIDLFRGTVCPLESEWRAGRRVWRSEFGKLQTRMFLASKEFCKMSPRPPEITRIGRRIPLNASPWKIRPDEPNVLVLDFPEISINGSAFREEYVLDADSRIRDVIGVPRRSSTMVQPWMQEKTIDSAKTAEVVLRYPFECFFIPSSLHLAVEHPEYYGIALNGKQISSLSDAGSWCDASLRKLPLPPEVLREKNILELRCTYHGRMCGLEALFLLGDFGVTNNVLTAPVRKLHPGDWCAQGFPNYSGNMIYELEFDWNEKSDNPVFLEIPCWRGTALGVAVNGAEHRPILHPPDRIEIRDFLRPGINRIELTVFGHRRNSHGPFYTMPTHCNMASPPLFALFSFHRRLLVPCGLLESPVLYQNQ